MSIQEEIQQKEKLLAEKQVIANWLSKTLSAAKLYCLDLEEEIRELKRRAATGLTERNPFDDDEPPSDLPF
jgi:NTP pyrophosphatase (non-canonical NTP hydrolase)